MDRPKRERIQRLLELSSYGRCLEIEEALWLLRAIPSNISFHSILYRALAKHSLYVLDTRDGDKLVLRPVNAGDGARYVLVFSNPDKLPEMTQLPESERMEFARVPLARVFELLPEGAGVSINPLTEDERLDIDAEDVPEFADSFRQVVERDDLARRNGQFAQAVKEGGIWSFPLSSRAQREISDGPSLTAVFPDLEASDGKSWAEFIKNRLEACPRLEAIARSLAGECVLFCQQYFSLNLRYEICQLHLAQQVLEQFYMEAGPDQTPDQQEAIAALFGSYYGEAFLRQGDANWGILAVSPRAVPVILWNRGGICFPWTLALQRVKTGMFAKEIRSVYHADRFEVL